MGTLATWVLIAIVGILSMTAIARIAGKQKATLFLFILAVIVVLLGFLFASGALCSVSFLHCSYK